jgi:hypothetical protein
MNQAYSLIPEEFDLMWITAPQRMPIARPIQKQIHSIPNEQGSIPRDKPKA